MFSARRNKSFISRDPDDNSASTGSDNDPKRSSKSFHAPTDLQRQRDSPGRHLYQTGGVEENTAIIEVDDLHETIANLKQSVMTHANSSAETMEHFTTLQKAHDTLYKEHVHLQEQMDDAVELLKYLKEEKGNYEERLMELNDELKELRGANEGSILSMTIETLTKEKMQLEQSLKEAKGRGEDSIQKIQALDVENSELQVKVESLQKVKEAYDLQTRQQLESKTKLNNLSKERGELMEKVRMLEKEANEHEEQLREREKGIENKLENLRRELEEERSSITTLKQDYSTLQQEKESAQSELAVLKEEQQTKEEEQTNNQLNQQESQTIKDLEEKLSDSLEQIARLQKEQRFQRESQTVDSSSLKELNDKVASLEKINKELTKEKDDLKVYANKVEETLIAKGDEIEATEEAVEKERAEVAAQIGSLKDQLTNYQQKQELLSKQLQASQKQQESMQEELQNYQQQAQQKEGEMEEEGESANEELVQENEELKNKVQELEDKLEEEQNNGNKVYPEELEKEMQERLAKRIAAQLHENKVDMEEELRATLEAEYEERLQQQQQELMEEFSTNQSVCTELEGQLRNQLVQVKDERERWQNEQDEIQRKVMDSQAQFEKVREGFKKKLEKEKARSKELEKANEGQQVVIEKLSEEYQAVMAQLEEIRTQIADSDQQSQQEWNDQKSDLINQHRLELEELALREERYAAQVHGLQNEVNDLLADQATHEREFEAWEKEKAALEKSHNEKEDELQRAMGDLEGLNEENAEYIRKMEYFESLVETMKEQVDESEESKVKYSVLQIEHKELKKELSKRDDQTEGTFKQMEQLNTENGELQQQIHTLEGSLDEVSKERNKLKDSLQETSELCLQMESKLSSYKQENEQTLEEYKSKIADLEKMRQTEASAMAALAVEAEKEIAVKNLAEMESKHKEVVDGLQLRINDMTSQVSKLIDQLSAISSEKATLASKFESVSSDLSAVKKNSEEQEKEIAELRTSVESVSAERDAVNLQVTLLSSGRESAEEMVTSLQTEKDDLLSAAEVSRETIVRLEAEKAEAVANIDRMEQTMGELCDKAESLAADLEASKSEIVRLKTQVEEQKINATHNISTVDNSMKDDYETKIRALQSVIDELKGTNAQLMSENSAIQAQNVPSASQSDEVAKLMQDLVEVNKNVQLLKQDHEAQLQKMKAEMRDLRDKNILLEDGLQDVQVEKEDLELENEELASKLTDLTTQAKKMLLNNESLEESIQDQQIEYEDRIAELESQLAEKYEDDELTSLHSKHKAALETIVRLKEEADMVEQDKPSQDNSIDADKLKQVEEENLELRQVVDHLSQENNAAKEIKFIVMELKAKNMEISESLRASQEQNTAAVDTIENLKADNEQLRKDIMAKQSDANNLIKAQAHDDHHGLPLDTAADDNSKMIQMEAELHQYKSIVSQMMSDRNLLNNRLGEMMDIPSPSQHASSNERALVPLDSNNVQDPLENAAMNQGMMVVATNNMESGSYAASSFALTPSKLHHPVDGIEEQIQNLTIENGQLAQRLGNAVADKEFAMTTLTKLGAKMEELMERNRLLSNVANMKSQHPSRGANYYSGGQSLKVNDFRPKHEVRGRDPDASGEDNVTSASPYYPAIEAPNNPTLPRNDDPSVCSDMGSTIISYGTTKKLEPESSASYVGGMSIVENDALERAHSGSREGSRQLSNDPEEAVSEEVRSTSKPRLVKVPGGEYFGQVNDLGQKHGNGKMRYDNGNEYDGDWKYNKRDGKGTTKYASGNVYTGTWKSGKRHGFGVFHIKKTGDIYRGNWRQGLKSGPGVYEYADGELDVSFYEEDIRVGEGVRWSASRHEASRLVDGQLVGEEGDMAVEDAVKLTKQLGFVV